MFRPHALAAAAFLATVPVLAMSAAPAPHLFDKAAGAEGAVFDTHRYRAKVKINADKLFAMQPGNRVTLVVPGMDTYTVVFDQIVTGNGGVREWHGHVAGEKDLDVVLVAAGDAITGVVRTPRKTFTLTQEKGANWLVWEYGAAAPAVTARAQSTSSTVALSHGTALMSASAKPVPAEAAHAMNLPANGTYEATLDIAALSTLPENSETMITLPNAGNFRVVYEHTDTSDTGAATWVGYLGDHGNDYRMMITHNGDNVEGRVLAPAGEYLIQSVGEKLYIVDVHRAGIISTPFTEADSVKPPTTTSTETSTSTAPVTATGATSTIDLLVLYTPGFVKYKGSEAAAKTRIDQLVALANQAYKDSGVGMKVRIVGHQQVDYPDNTNNNDALDELGWGRGAFSKIFALRDKVGADMVTLLRPFSYASQKTCGSGYVGGLNGKPMSTYSAYAFSVVSDGADPKSNFYCTDYGLTHELGHNMGNMHDRESGKGSGSTSTGAYPYSFGYGIEGRFGTIMSYKGPRVGKFSNPHDHTCAGNLPCGISEHDTANSAHDALSLNNVRAAVAAFRPTRVTQTYGISGTVKYNGKGLKDVVISGDGAKCNKTGSNGTYSCTVPEGWSNKLRATHSSYTFKPSSITFNNVQGGVSGRNFTATRK